MTCLRVTACLGLMLCLVSCSPQEQQDSPERIRVLLDTDANNELDDQHAIAYMLLFLGEMCLGRIHHVVKSRDVLRMHYDGEQ